MLSSCALLFSFCFLFHFASFVVVLILVYKSVLFNSFSFYFVFMLRLSGYQHYDNATNMIQWFYDEFGYEKY